MIWTTSGQDYEAVCDLIGWRTDVQAIEVSSAPDRVDVRPTAVKPLELQQLKGWHNATLPDGRRIAVVIGGRRLPPPSAMPAEWEAENAALREEGALDRTQ